MSCPQGWGNPQAGWCTDPSNGTGYTLAASQKIAGENAGGGFWGNFGTVLGGATGIVEVLFGDGNTNDTTTVINQQQQSNSNNYIIIGGVVLIVLLLLFLIFR